MAAAPLVSVIVPNYNYGNVLSLCLRSVQAQTYSPLEIVFVDDCSTDDSVRIAETLGVPVTRTTSNVGVSAARNLGATVASGEILFFLDSDIALDPGAVAAAVAILRSDPKIGAVCGNFETVPLIRDSLVKEYRNLFRHYYFRAAEGPISGFLPTAMIAIPMGVWEEVGPFSTHLTQSEGADVGERLADRYEVRLTSAVRGCHDDDPTLRVALRKVFIRTRVQVPFFLQRRYAAGVIGSPESGASLTTALTAATLPLPFVLGWWWAALPVLLFAACLTIDRRMYRFVFGCRGVPFGLFFGAVHFLVNLTIAAGAAVGIGQWLVSRSFRRLYAKAPA